MKKILSHLKYKAQGEGQNYKTFRKQNKWLFLFPQNMDEFLKWDMKMSKHK